jgi:hypothetical protein
MPYLQVSVSEKMDDIKIDELKAMFGRYISLLPGKSEEVLMLRIDDDETMFFSGISGKCAMIQVHLYQASPRDAKKIFSAEVLQSFSSITGLPVDRIFMNFSEHTDWAAGGSLI